MKYSKLKDEYLKEESFWHVTSKGNLKSIEEKGLVPNNGIRNGEVKEVHDIEARVFFSQGIETTLAQGNNMGFHIENWLRGVPKNKEGLSVNEIKNGIKNFFGRSKSDKSEKGEIDSNGGFLDIVRYIKEDLRKKGMDENVTEEEFKDLVYDSIQTLWENQVCIKGNIIENEDYSYETDYNYSGGGKEKIKMSKMDMHTFKDRIIDTDKLEVMVDDNGKPMTMLEVYKNMAKYYKKEDPDKRLPVKPRESYAYNEKTGEWEVIGYNYSEDYITTLTEREKEKDLLEKEENNLPMKIGFFEKIKQSFKKIKEIAHKVKEWIDKKKDSFFRENIKLVDIDLEELEKSETKDNSNKAEEKEMIENKDNTKVEKNIVEEEKAKSNVINEEKEIQNNIWDQKITNSEILENEAVKEKIEEYMNNLNNKVENSNRSKKKDKDLEI